MTARRFVIATRGSQLALWQANYVKERLEAVRPGCEVELAIIKTSGDAIQDIPLAKVGGKGLFVKEIEHALLARTADLAVHSMKDLPPELAAGLKIAAVSSREVPWDALCMRGPGDLDSLAKGAVVGTSSMRRQCQLLAHRPDLQIKMLRGNVPTRIAKLEAGEFDAIVLAAAGLVRLGMVDKITQLLPMNISIPAVAQGVLAIEVRADDLEVEAAAYEAINDAMTAPCVIAERAFLSKMGGSCTTPLAAHAAYDLDTEELVIAGMCGLPDGTKILRGEVAGWQADSIMMGEQLADDLLAQGAGDILAATRL